MLSADQFRAVVNANGTAAQKAMLGSANTDWQAQIYHPAFGTNNNLSKTGGSIKTLPYRLSLGHYQNQDGILKTDNLQRLSEALALNPVLFDNHLKVDLNIKVIRAEDTTLPPQITAAIGAGAIGFDPTQPVYDKKSKTGYGGYYEMAGSHYRYGPYQI